MESHRYKHIVFYSVFSFWLIFVSANFVSAQEGQNPFDIGTSPLETTTNTNPTNQSETNNVATNATADNPFAIGEAKTNPPPAISTPSSNPFDLSVSTMTATEAIPIVSTPTITKPKKKPKKNTTQKSASTSFLLVLIIIMVVLFAVAVTLFRSYIIKIYQAFVNDSYLQAAYREMGTIIPFPYMILYGLFLFNASIFFYLLTQYFGINIGTSWGGVLWFIGLVSLIFFIKHFLVKFAGWIFPISKEINIYNFIIIVFNIILGIVFVPLNLLMAYSPEDVTWVIVYSASIIIMSIYLYRGLRSLLVASKYIAMHKFHFFMYLCVVEVAPLLILVKYILLQTGI